MEHLKVLLGEFHRDLDRARHLLQLIKAFREFGSEDVPEGVRTSGSWPTALTLAEEAPKVRTDLPILAGSLLLYVCGRFEYFVREMVAAIADGMAGSGYEFSGSSRKASIRASRPHVRSS